MSNRLTGGVIAMANTKSCNVELNFLPGMTDADKVGVVNKLIAEAQKVKSSIEARGKTQG